jgi:2-methylcitrate dehydratase PrpD
VLAAIREEVLAAVEKGRSECRAPQVERALSVSSAYRTPAQATVWGRSERLGVTWAAFVNASASGSPVVAAALAVGEWLDLSQEQAVLAMATAKEAGRRVEAALRLAPGRRNWAEGGAADSIGAAAAVGRLLGLDPVRQAMAISLAVTQAAGLGAAAASEGGRAFWHGHIAFDGVEAALLARDGYTAPTTGIEGRRGLAALTAPGADLGAVIAGLGVEWRPAESR